MTLGRFADFSNEEECECLTSQFAIVKCDLATVRM